MLYFPPSFYEQTLKFQNLKFCEDEDKDIELDSKDIHTPVIWFT